MDHIFVRSDFAERHEYRLVSMDDAWVKQFREETCVPPSHRSTSKGKRSRRADDDADSATSVALIMKGEDQLWLHDATTTRSVRRVEYSNVLMLAHRRLNAAGQRAMCAGSAPSEEEPSAASKPADTPLSLVQVREYHDNIVIASLSRMFDSHAANPQLNVLTVLANSYLTIDELEAAEDGADEARDATRRTSAGVEEKAAPDKDGTAAAGFTFAELTRRLHSSPAELAHLLQVLGAVVHRGKVRLLHPSLVYEALGAVLTYLDAADPQEVSWTAVQRHLCPSVYPPVVVRALQAVYGTSGASGGDSKESNDVAVTGLAGLLNLPRVLVGLAAGVFDTHDATTRRTLSTGEVVRGLPLDAFMERWFDSIPSSLFGVGGVPSRHGGKSVELFLELLRGCAVLEPRSGSGGSASPTSGNSSSSTALMQGTLWWMPKELLTNDFAARLRVLFELRPQRWNLAELQAYMEVLLAPDQSFQHIMVRYAREYRIPGQVVQYAPLT